MRLSPRHEKESVFGYQKGCYESQDLSLITQTANKSQQVQGTQRANDVTRAQQASGQLENS